MLNFCPYDFRKFDEDNLAYEISFYGDKKTGYWTWENVEEFVDFGDEAMSYVEKSEERKIFFNVGGLVVDDGKVDEPLMFLAAAQGCGKEKNGLEMFKKLLLDRKKKLEEEQKADTSGIWKEQEILTHEMSEDGEDVFVTNKGKKIMCAIPCCPYCHNRLPIGWKEAKAFGAVGLMAPTGGGKTTFLYSMMNDNWKILQETLENSEELESITISSAHWDDDEIYNELLESAEAMCQERGECPQNTNDVKWISPVFLKLEYKGQHFMMGIYDNAGERLAKMGKKDVRVQILIDKMFALMFLFEPKMFPITIPNDKSEKLKTNLKDCKMMSIEEQGEKQRKESGTVIRGEDLLDSYWKVENEKKNALEVYDSYMKLVKQKGGLENLKNMNFFGILIKSDLLEHTDEIKNADGIYDSLFKRVSEEDVFDETIIELRSKLTQRLISEFGFFSEKKMMEFRKRFGELDAKGNETGRESVYWHCVSALGCDVEKRDEQDMGRLKGEYEPMHVADPMAQCIVNFIKEQGWI